MDRGCHAITCRHDGRVYSGRLERFVNDLTESLSDAESVSREHLMIVVSFMNRGVVQDNSNTQNIDLVS